MSQGIFKLSSGNYEYPVQNTRGRKDGRINPDAMFREGSRLEQNHLLQQAFGPRVQKLNSLMAYFLKAVQEASFVPPMVLNSIESPTVRRVIDPDYRVMPYVSTLTEGALGKAMRTAFAGILPAAVTAREDTDYQFKPPEQKPVLGDCMVFSAGKMDGETFSGMDFCGPVERLVLKSYGDSWPKAVNETLAITAATMFRRSFLSYASTSRDVSLLRARADSKGPETDTAVAYSTLDPENLMHVTFEHLQFTLAGLVMRLDPSTRSRVMANLDQRA